MNRRKVRITLSVCAVAALYGGNARAQTAYTISDLGIVTPQGINSVGQITGNITTPGGGRAFIWTPTVLNGTTGATTILGLPKNFTAGQGKAINDSGQVAGWGGKSYYTYAVLWSGGTAVNLGFITGSTGTSAAYGINASGEIAGFSTKNQAPTATFLWKPTSPNGTTGKMYDLLLPGGGAYSGPGAYGINSHGQIASYNHSFIWTPTTANATTGASISAPWSPCAINDAGQTTGLAPYTWIGPDGSSYAENQPAIYNPGSGLRPLGFPLDTVLPAGTSWRRGQCWAISNGALMVGDALASSGVSPSYNTVWVWDSLTGMRDLNVNNSIAGTGWVLSAVVGVNSVGQIVGTGTFGGASRGFLLTPR